MRQPFEKMRSYAVVRHHALEIESIALAKEVPNAVLHAAQREPELTIRQACDGRIVALFKWKCCAMRLQAYDLLLEWGLDQLDAKWFYLSDDAADERMRDLQKLIERDGEGTGSVIGFVDRCDREDKTALYKIASAT